MDENGYIYVVTANGTYDGPAGGNDFGDSVLKMGWTGNVFGVADYFTPYNQLQLSQNDLDLGSSGPLVLPDQPGLYPHELLAGGKQGTLYLVNLDNPGKYNATTDSVIQSVPGAVIGELAGVPSYWNRSVYVAGDLDYIKQFSLINGLLTQQPVSQTTVTLVALVRLPPRSLRMGTVVQSYGRSGTPTRPCSPSIPPTSRTSSTTARKRCNCVTTSFPSYVSSLQPSRTARCISVERPLWRCMGCCRSSRW